MMFQPIRRSFAARSEDLHTHRTYRYDEEEDEAETMMFQPILMPINAQSEDLHTRKRYRYDEEMDGAETMMSLPTLRPFAARSEDFHTRRRYRYGDERDGAETMMSQPIRRHFAARSVDFHKRRTYRCGEERDGAETMMSHSIRRHFAARSVDFHTRRTYRCCEERDGAETIMSHPIRRHFAARSVDFHTRRGYRYGEERDGAETIMFQPIRRPCAARSVDFHKRRRYRYVEESDGEQKLSHTILRSESLQVHKRYGCVEKDQTDAASRPSIEYLFWNAKHFEHFHYVYSLARDCKTRVEKLLKNNDPAYQMPEDVTVKIGIVGHHTKDNVNLISKTPGKSKLMENQYIWGAQPLVCFENESSSKLKLKSYLLKKNTLHPEGVCHKIFIRSDTFCDKANRDEDKDDDFIISVGQDKDQIGEIIASCLEEPLQKTLQQWRKGLKRRRFEENALDIIAEIDAISKELVLINSKDTDVPISDSKSIVPVDVKHFLFRRSDVNSFGIWNNSVFKVFVRKTTGCKELKDELTKLNKNFFQQYDLEIEKKTEIQTLMREDNVTGFVTKTNNNQEMYALTCNHLFPRENEQACTRHLEKVVACVPTTKTKGCDVAAVEIKECYSNSCDVTFVKDNKKKINANFYSNSLQTGDDVHKKKSNNGCDKWTNCPSRVLFKGNGQKQPGKQLPPERNSRKVFRKRQ